MHKNELVNVLVAARTDVKRHQERLNYLTAAQSRARPDVDTKDAEEVRRLLNNIIRELDEAVTQRSLGY